MNDTKHPPSFATGLDVRIATLSPEKRALLERRLAADRSAARGEHVTARADLADGTRLPLSFSQQRLWFLDQWQTGGSSYNIARGWWLQGSLDVPQLQQAFAHLIARHASLRTAFVNEGGQPRQRVAGRARRGSAACRSQLDAGGTGAHTSAG